MQTKELPKINAKLSEQIANNYKKFNLLLKQSKSKEKKVHEQEQRLEEIIKEAIRERLSIKFKRENMVGFFT